MQVFLDVDGVLLDLEASFVRFLNQHQGFNLPEGYRARTFDFAELTPAHKVEASWKAFTTSEDSAQMPPLVRSDHFNEQTIGCSVHLLTNFPVPQMHHRWANLRLQGFCYQGLHYCGLKSHETAIAQPKSAIIKQLLQPGQVAIFVDDVPENCLDVVQYCPEVEVWLMTHPFNKTFHHQDVRRALDWSILFHRLQQLRKK